MNNKGQNMVEYIALVAAVVIVFIVFLGPYSPFKAKVETSLFNGTVKQLNRLSGDINF